MAYALFYRGMQAVTARLEVRYRRAVNAGEELVVEAGVIRENRRLVDVQSRLLHGSVPVAEATGRFVKVGPLTGLSLSV